MSFNKELFCNFINVRYLHLTFFVQRDNRWVNSDNANIFFTIYGRFKILYCHFQKIDFSNFKITFAKHSFFMTDLQSSFKVLLCDKTLPCGYFWQYNGGPANIYFFLFSFFITISAAFDRNKDIEMGPSFFRNIFALSQPAMTCSKLARETIKKYVKYNQS